MPNTRWWAFEDGRTNFGDVDADTTDLAKLLFLEFGARLRQRLVPVPCDAAGGHARDGARDRGDQRVRRADSGSSPPAPGADDDWQRWSMFTARRRGRGGRAGRHAACCSCRPCRRSQEGAPLEEVVLVRDEMANMVWGVERIVPLRHRRRASRGARGGRETRAYLARAARQRAGCRRRPAAAPIRYQVMSTVPEHWIPFVPVHVRGRQREIQLQRAALPRILEGEPPATTRSRRAPCCCATASTCRRPTARSPTSCTRRRSRVRARGSPRASSARAGATAGGRLARRRPADRPRRGLERPGVRPARGRAAGGVTGLAAGPRPRGHDVEVAGQEQRATAGALHLAARRLGKLRGLTARRADREPLGARDRLAHVADHGGGVELGIVADLVDDADVLAPAVPSYGERRTGAAPQGRDRRARRRARCRPRGGCGRRRSRLLDPAGDVQLAIAQDSRGRRCAAAAGERGRRLAGPQ